jgi:exopolysaccharide biosynthesis polyprenyl glycosylphosphotransferase
MTQQAAIGFTEEEDAAVASAPPLIALAGSRGVPAADLTPLSLDRSVPRHLESRESLHRRLLIGADVVAMTGALVAILSHAGIGVGALVALAVMPFVLLVFTITGLYNLDELRIKHSTLDELPVLLQLTALFALSIAILHPSFPAGSLSRSQIALFWGLSFAAVATGRVLVRTAARRILPVERCFIIGDGPEADRVRHRIAASRARTVIVDAAPGDRHAHLGHPDTIVRLVRELGIHRIIIAPLRSGRESVIELIRIAKAVNVRVSVVPGMLEVVGSGAAFDEVEGMAMLGIPAFGLCRTSRVLKRTFDLVATVIGLVAISPVIAIIAAAIRLDSKGPIFFRQVRVGRDGRPFYIIKFRSMVGDAEVRKDQLRALNVAGEGLFKLRDDPRVTRVGRFLRSTSLDELPQLFNVIRGEMSLVGPRPLVTDEDAQVLGLDRSRLRLKPGMTGPWQLLGSRVPLQEMVEIDYLYASHWSLWLDCKILLRTVQYVVRQGNL